MKKKIANNKIIIASILGLSCLTAIGVGFSAWVISQEDKISDVGQISAKVDDIVDSRFSAKVTMTDADITFGPKVGSSNKIAASDGTTEDLNYAFIITFSPRDEEETTFPTISENVSYEVSYEFTGKMTLDEYGDSKQNFVTFPAKTTLGTLSSSGLTLATGLTGGTATPTYTDESNQTLSGYTLTYTGSLGWGTVFKSMNPSDDSSLSDSEVTTTVKNLKTLSSVLAGATEDNHLEITVYVERVGATD